MARVVVKQCGRISYAAGLTLQESLVSRFKNSQQKGGEVAGKILLCEHDPVYTFGLRDKQEYAKNVEWLRQLGAEVFKVRRGGLTTFHGPGQLVCYPVLDLRAVKLGVKQYVKSLEQSIIRTCAKFGVLAHTTEYTGVWVGDKKLCALGIQVTNGVAFHGLALNCSTDLSWFDHIIPCGIEGKGVTSLSQLLGRTVPPPEVAPVLIKSLTGTLGLTEPQ